MKPYKNAYSGRGKFLIAVFCFLCKSQVVFSQFSPSSISGLQLWLKADSGVILDGSNRVMEWDDISGNNNNFTQGFIPNRPDTISNSLLNKKALQFTSGKTLINSTLLNGTSFPSSSASLFVVWGINGISNKYGVISTRNSGIGYWRNVDGMGYFQNFRNA